MSDENIFSEVDEELRREQIRSLWRRFAPWVFGAAAVIVLAVALNEGWAWYRNSQAAAQSDRFYAAAELAEDGDYAAAIEGLSALEAEGGGYAVLASFRQAGALAQSGKTDEAIAAYDALANESDNQQLRELALLQGALLLVDGGDVAGVRSRVDGLTAPENPLRTVAHEAIGLAQYAAGDLDGARATFEAALDDLSGDAQANGRMQVYLAQVIAEGAADPSPDEQTAAEAPAESPAADTAEQPAQ